MIIVPDHSTEDRRYMIEGYGSAQAVRLDIS